MGERIGLKIGNKYYPKKKGSFSIFINKKKRDGHQDPDYNGFYRDDNKIMYRIGGFKNTEQKGGSNMSGRITRMDEEFQDYYDEDEARGFDELG